MLALQNGKHLFVEKPIAPSYEQAVELALAASSRGLVAAAGLNRRFFKSIMAVREKGGAAGWRYAEATFHKPEFRKPPAFGARSFLSANGIHALDVLLFMMGGPPQEISAYSGESGAAAPSAFSAIMRWPDGAQGIFLCNNNAGSRLEQYAFHGPGETYRIDDSGLTVDRNGTVTKTSYSAIGDGIEAEHRAFLRSVHAGNEPTHSIRSIAPSLFLAELIEAGYCGAVNLPQLPTVAAVPREVPSRALLVVPSPELQPGLAFAASQYRLVTLEDLRASLGTRPDVVGAVLGRGASPIPRDLLDRLPALSVVGIMGLSLARHDPQPLLERGITLVNSSAAYADSVAELALALAILGRRRAFASDSIMRAGGWGTDPGSTGLAAALKRGAKRLRPALRRMGLESAMLKVWRTALGRGTATSRGAILSSRDLRGAIVGLLGWGENARVLAAHLRHVGAEVVVYSENAPPEGIRSSGAKPVTLGEALVADVVSLHRGLTARTRHFLGAAELARLRPGAVLINTARGALIEPAALLARLRQGDIFACLDAYEDEPPSPSDPLRMLPNVFLTSHIAGGSADMHRAAANEVIDKVLAQLDGRPTATISSERFKTMS
jgi:phosphoglycerate dehydrogenase-like enzyme